MNSNVVLITGVSKGLGKAITKEVIKLGGKVVGVARSESELIKLQEELNTENFSYIVGDITNSQIQDDLINLAIKNSKIANKQTKQSQFSF